MNKLSLVSVCKKFSYYGSESTIFSNLNYVFSEGSRYAIMAPSGKGKSTLLHLLAGIDVPTQGKIYCNDKDISTLENTARALHVSLLMQSSHFIPELSVHENAAVIGFITLPKNQAFEKAAFLLKEVGLAHYLSYPIGALSGGQRQRLGLVCALINNPTFLITDELTGNLDQETADHTMKVLLQLQQLQQFGFIITTHDPHIALYMDLVLTLQSDRLVPIDKNLITLKAMA